LDLNRVHFDLLAGVLRRTRLPARTELDGIGIRLTFERPDALDCFRSQRCGRPRNPQLAHAFHLRHATVQRGDQFVELANSACVGSA
jgi:hypothetical protein